MSYGFCPKCGAEAIRRERRLNGDDICANGHKYPSKDTLNEEPSAAWLNLLKRTPEEIEAIDNAKDAEIALLKGELAVKCKDCNCTNAMLENMEYANTIARLEEKITNLEGWKQIIEGVKHDSGALIGWMSRAEAAELKVAELKELIGELRHMAKTHMDREEKVEAIDHVLKEIP